MHLCFIVFWPKEIKHSDHDSLEKLSQELFFSQNWTVSSQIHTDFYFITSESSHAIVEIKIYFSVTRSFMYHCKCVKKTGLKVLFFYFKFDWIYSTLY